MLSEIWERDGCVEILRRYSQSKSRERWKSMTISTVTDKIEFATFGAKPLPAHNLELSALTQQKTVAETTFNDWGTVIESSPNA